MHSPKQTLLSFIHSAFFVLNHLQGVFVCFKISSCQCTLKKQWQMLYSLSQKGAQRPEACTCLQNKPGAGGDAHFTVHSCRDLGIYSSPLWRVGERVRFELQCQ